MGDMVTGMVHGPNLSILHAAPQVGAPPGSTSRGRGLMNRFKWDTAHRGNRCGHAWCTDCKTRRGRNRGNRNVRHAVRVALHRLTG
jgi:hypothetical protein